MTPSFKQLTNWLFPLHCLSCRGSVTDDLGVCDECLTKLPYPQNCCDSCGQFFTADAGICGRCLTSPPPYDRFFSTFDYQSPIKDQILQLKYADQPFLAKRLAKHMSNELHARGIAMPQMLVPVPMSTDRLRKRGYNQASLLCRCLSRELGTCWSPSLVQKIRETTPQAQLTLRQRQTNLRGCFKVHRHPLPEHIAIIDDVMTTGATASELSASLRKAGVTHIQVWVLAHTLAY